MPDQAIVICLPIDVPGYRVPGSVERRCSKCNGRVSASPSSLELIRTRGASILCVPCVDLADVPGKLMPLTPMQTGEIFKGLIDTG